MFSHADRKYSYYGTKWIELKDKPVGRDFMYGRELVIIGRNGDVKFSHRSKCLLLPQALFEHANYDPVRLSQMQSCYPYTWHRDIKEHHPLEVTFKELDPERHSITTKGKTPVKSIPTYIFTNPEDYKEFQGHVRDKDLKHWFEVRRIACASSNRNGEATDQHLKIWRDRFTQVYSISFYASTIAKPRHLEFPISMLDRKISASEDWEVRLNFNTVTTKPEFKMSSSSRSPTERTDSYGKHDQLILMQSKLTQCFRP
jgi:hypothetical protein